MWFIKKMDAKKNTNTEDLEQTPTKGETQATPEETIQIQEEPVTQESVKHHGEEDPSFNCPTCIGDGLLSNGTVCSTCQGTGKV